MPFETSTLILSPHCDDAPLSLGAALLTRDPRQEVHVCIVFSRSRFTTQNFLCDGPEEEITLLRNQEERQAAKIARYGLDLWGFPEPFVRSGFQERADLFDVGRPLVAEAVWEPVCSAIDQAMGKHEGLVLAPLGCGGHVDHRLVREAFLECRARHPHLRSGFYEDLPYCNALSDEQILSALPALPGLQFRSHVVSEGLEQKLALLQEYRSQPMEKFAPAVKSYWNRRGGERLWIANHTPFAFSETTPYQ